MSGAGFWDRREEADRIIRELKSLKSIVEPFQKLQGDIEDFKELIQEADESDEETIASFAGDIKRLKHEVDSLEFKSLLSREEDRLDAILSINAGAGGTESCDWAAMLLRMYMKWAETGGYQFNQVDFLPGEEAGIKNVTIEISGSYAYGYLKSETGVHRLVRISPFDANKRRHTSFVSIDVIPEVDENVDIDIRAEELRVDTYRAGGAGGQHVNKTDSAVRITHLPTGIVVQCQNERSQHKNKATAMKLLKSKMYEMEIKKREEAIGKAYDAKSDIAWGSQIRSYVMHPYSMVKDHRTGFQTSDVDGVMNGDIDLFIENYLKWKK